VNQPAAKKPEPQKKPDFERSLARLEEVVRRLESPQLSLDEAMKLFEEGVGLSRECQKQLEEAEGRVEILLKKADGKMAPNRLKPKARTNRERLPMAQTGTSLNPMKLPPFLKKTGWLWTRNWKSCCLRNRRNLPPSILPCAIRCLPEVSASGQS